MVIAEYYRSLIRHRTLAQPWPMTDQEARRYRCWQRYTRRMRALDAAVQGLRMLLVKRYNAELARINADDLGYDTNWTQNGGGTYIPSEYFEAERWRRS